MTDPEHIAPILRRSLSSLATSLDPYDHARLQAMLAGYAALWDNDPVEVLDVEREFTMPLVDDLGCEHPHWMLTGRIDLVIARGSTVQIVDHKSTSDADGSAYARRAVINGQAGMYFDAAEQLGYPASEFVFDVLVKPAQRPKEGENPAQFGARCAEAIAKDPARFYSRITITREEAAQVDHRKTIWEDAELIDIVSRRGLHGANSDACFRYGSLCQFWQTCAGMASLDDDTLYQPSTYADRFGKQLLSESRRSAFNACRRKHHYLFDLKRQARSQPRSLTFGTVMHEQLETYWRRRMPALAAE